MINRLSIDDIGETALPQPFSGNFDDMEWSAFAHSAGRERIFNWQRIDLGDGSQLSAKKNRELLIGFKIALILCALGTDAVMAARASTLSGQFDTFKELVRWMSTRDLRSFGALTTAHAIGYRNHLQRRRALAGGRPRGPGSPRLVAVTDRPLTPRTQDNYLSAIRRLALFQSEMGRYGTRFTPSECMELADHLRCDQRAQKPTPAISDDKFREVMVGAINWITIEAPKVLKIQSSFNDWRDYRATSSPMVPSRTANYRQFASDNFGEETIELDGCTRDLLSITHNELDRLLTITRGACFAVIAGLVGMRVSEILSLEQGCVKMRLLDSGVNILEIEGMLYKTSRNHKGILATWVAGYDEEKNPVRLAINILTALPRTGGSRHLFVSFYEQSKWKRERITQSGMRNAVNLFAAAIRITDWVFSPHQFRKSFARFVARSSTASVFALMRHYKHASVLMTERYVTSDPELANEIFEETQTLLSERLESVFGADRLGGIGGKRIIANNANYRGPANHSALKRLVAATLRDPSAYFRLTPAGICIYDAPKAKCFGNLENVGIDVCVGCSNFAVSEANLPAWRERVTLFKTLLAEQEAAGFRSLDTLRQLAEAEQVVATLTGL